MIQQSLLDEDASLTSAFVVILTLLLLSIAYAWLRGRLPARLAGALEGVPTVLVRDGVPDEHRLRRSRVTLDDVLEAGRRSGVADLAGIRFAVLETGGTISIIPNAGQNDGPATPPAETQPRPG
nr:YetF domain-containing protein [Roseomonas acroporae]